MNRDSMATAIKEKGVSPMHELTYQNDILRISDCCSGNHCPYVASSVDLEMALGVRRMADLRSEKRNMA